MRMLHNVFAPIVQHCPPFRRRRLRPKPEEGQPAGSQNRNRDAESGLDDDGRSNIRQDMLENNAAVARTKSPHGIDVFQLANRQRRSPHNPGEGRNREDADRNDDIEQTLSESAYNRQSQQQTGERQQNIADAHDDRIPYSPIITGEDTENDSEDCTEEGCDEADRQGDPRSMDNPREDIPAVMVRSEPMVCGRLQQLGGIVDDGRIMLGKVRTEDSNENDKKKKVTSPQRRCVLP